jgi:glycosyltransferase involved in cell wall biosynthesis
MKLLVFAHVPPPHHGQSYMVQLMLNSFGGDQRKRKSKAGGELPNHFGIECYHVNARISKQLEDIGDFRLGKLLLLLGYCVEAIYVRFRYGATNFYYVPAPGKAVALYRDWLVMFLCRPFFKRVILHWHAASLASWLETFTTMSARRITYHLVGQVDLSIVLSNCNRFNAEKLLPRRIEVVGNGIPDPCAEFETRVLPRRRARIAARKKLMAGQELTEQERAEAGAEPQVIRALFLAHCSREKGLFDAVQGVVLAFRQLQARHSSVSIRLIVAGSFQSPEDRNEFERLCSESPAAVQYVGFVQGPEKERAMLEADLLCFPSHWDNQPVSVIEALAFGLPAVISRLPSVQEMLPADYPGVVDLGKPAQMAAALLDLACFEDFEQLRRHFLSRFTLECHLANLAEAIHSVETAEPTPALQPAAQNP